MTTITELLDFQIEKRTGPIKRTCFALSREQYEQLCNELKSRPVKYKGARLMVVHDEPVKRKVKVKDSKALKKLT